MALPPEDDEREDLPTRVAQTLVRRPWRVVAVAAAIAIASGALVAGRLAWRTDRQALIGLHHDFNRGFQALRADFPDVDAVVVIGRAPTPEVGAAWAWALVERAGADPRVGRAFAGVPDGALRGRALLFLGASDLEELARRLDAGRGAIRAIARDGVAGLLDQVADDLERALARPAPPAPDGAEARGLSLGLDLLGGVAAAGCASLAGDTPAPAPWAGLVPPALQARDGLVRTRRGEPLALLVPAGPDPAAGAATVAAAREHVAALRARFPEVEVGLTGGPALEADEAATVARDARRVAGVSLAGAGALLLLAFRRGLGPLLALLVTGWALAVTLGLAAAWPGELNVVSAAFGAVLLGLGIDHGVHVIARYDEARAGGRPPGPPALAEALRRAGPSSTGGALALALAALAMLFAELDGIRELGLVTGAGALVALVAHLGLLPALVVLVDRGPGGRRRRPRSAWPRNRAARAWDRTCERRPGVVLAAGLALAGLALAFAFAPRGGEGPRLRWEPSLLRLQASGLEAARLAVQVLEDEGLTGMFATVVVDDLAALARVESAVRALPAVARTESLLDVVPAEQPRKLALLARLRGALDDVDDDGGDPARAHRGLEGAPRARVLRAEAAAGRLADALERAARGALEAGRDAATDALLARAAEVDRLHAAALDAAVGPPAAAAPRAAAFAAWERALAAGLAERLARLRLEAGAGPVGPDDLPPEVRERFVGRSGKLLLRVYPRGDVWRADERARFLAEVRAVVPDAGGFPLLLHEADRLLRAGVARAAGLALAFAAVFLLVHLRDPVAAGAVLLVLAVGAAWALGALALLGLELNPANLLAAPLTLGIGVGYALHLVERVREARARRSVARVPAVLATATGRAVLFSAATSAVGFGALALSSHRGLASLGWAIAAGVLGCAAAAVLLTPALLRLRAGPWPAWPARGFGGPRTGPGGAPRRPPPEP